MDSSAAPQDAGGSNSLSSIQIRVIELDKTWVQSIQRELKDKPRMLREEAGSPSCCIHRVPPNLRQHNEKAYTPVVVSFGPFHRDNPKLKAMEEHKRRYLNKAISRATDRGLETFLIAVQDEEQRARECYSEVVDLDSNAFVKMMVFDACFIVEILLMSARVLIADPNDPIFNQEWLMDLIREDMLLLENQVPFCILERLFDLMKSSIPGSKSLKSISLKFFYHIGNFSHGQDSDPKHLLHLLQSCVLPDMSRLPTNPSLEAIPCAKQLREAGVKFKKGDAKDFLEIRFKDGVLEIPPIDIQDGTNSLFSNLIAFEQCYCKRNQYITAYMFMMDWLVDSAEDVLILRDNGIIENMLGSDEEVADLFNKLGRDVLINTGSNYLSNIAEDINGYRRRPWHAWRASLIQKYFYNPWAIISLIGAAILLVLTFTQTFFAVFTYSNPPS